jgi:23S rRNA (cytidine1920-2'-O)/16S rRNA (cytidine1409-2'-O)-methyltransferase
MRADQLLVSRGIAPTRSAAQRLIARGGVRWRAGADWSLPRKAGEDLPDDCEVEVTDDAELRFVSRGGLKLEGALAHTGIEPHGANCLDVGQGTGGFSDVLLQRGAARVVGIDVGHGQLNPRVAEDPRVTSHEGLNARDVQGSAFESGTPLHSFDLVTGDLSFISLTLVLPTLARYLAPRGQLLMLVKPQFELQPQHIGKGGIVKDPASYAVVEQRIRDACNAQGLAVRDYFASAIDGGDGNREFFVWAGAATTPHQGEAS